MARERMPRNAVECSFWQFEGDEPDGDADVEAMPSGLSFVRSDGRVLVAVRGKPKGGRYEPRDSVWLEFDLPEAIRFLSQLAAEVAAETADELVRRETVGAPG